MSEWNELELSFLICSLSGIYWQIHIKIQKSGSRTEGRIKNKKKKLISNLKTELEWKQELIMQ